MKFLEYVSEVDKEELEKVFVEEKENDDFLNQEDHSTCLERVEKANEIASVRGNNIKALATACHRNKFHNEDRTGEILELESKLSVQEDITRAREAGESKDVWN